MRTARLMTVPSSIAFLPNHSYKGRNPSLHRQAPPPEGRHLLSLWREAPLPLKADPLPLKADPLPLKADPLPLKADPLPLKADPLPLKADPSL